MTVRTVPKNLMSYVNAPKVKDTRKLKLYRVLTIDRSRSVSKNNFQFVFQIPATYVLASMTVQVKIVVWNLFIQVKIEFETEAHFPLNRMQDPKKYAIQSACMKLYSGWSNIEELMR